LPYKFPLKSKREAGGEKISPPAAAGLFEDRAFTAVADTTNLIGTNAANNSKIFWPFGDSMKST
jgi:hypothetical protein